MDELTELQEWYSRHCDGHWEHGYGVRIETLDNPGWALTVRLSCTELAHKQMEFISIERSEEDWMHCFVENSLFKARGGPLNLQEMLSVFLRFAVEAPT